jgi:hypothetical protein
MNLTYTKFRNRLTIERVDKLCYIYINRKILNRSKVDWEILKRRLDQLTFEEALELENTLLAREYGRFRGVRERLR